MTVSAKKRMKSFQSSTKTSRHRLVSAFPIMMAGATATSIINSGTSSAKRPLNRRFIRHPNAKGLPSTP